MTDIPPGYYAVEIYDIDADETTEEYGQPIGYQTVRRTRTAFSPVTTHYLAGADQEVVNRNASTFAELLEYVGKYPDMCREDFGRLTGKCGCCGRTLTDPESVRLGIGPDCRRVARG